MLSYIIIIIVAVFALIGTIYAAFHMEEDYSKKTKHHTMRLSWIYIIVIILSLLALALYIVLK